MNPRVKNVKPVQDFTLLITFNNGEEKSFDVKPYLVKDKEPKANKRTRAVTSN